MLLALFVLMRSVHGEASIFVTTFQIVCEGVKEYQMNNKFLKIALSSALLLASHLSNASVITLDFEGVGDGASINEFYNGGTDSLGNSGVNYGISFGADSLGLIDSDAGGTGNFANEPTADTALFFSSGTAILNNALGFDTGFSFYYTSAATVAINVFSGLDLTGDLLGSIALSANFQDSSCVGDANGSFCNWDIGSLGFAGTAKSIDFGGSANLVAFDNITFGATNPEPEAVSEPSTLAIFALGLMGLASRRFKKQS
jgi:hypothetical protein